jgi:hypothetical protein
VVAGLLVVMPVFQLPLVDLGAVGVVAAAALDKLVLLA